jgi:UDP-N-acetylmuramoylalanine--D-glutamate ligase
MEIAGKRVMVLGLARTGIALARFLVARGASVTLSDCRPQSDLSADVQSLSSLPLSFRLGGEEPSWLEGIDLVVPSPGVPQENSLLREASRRGVPVLSEIELAFRFLRAPLVSITGTNGKSTTTALTGEILKAAGLKVFVGGNIGVPLIDFVSGDWDWGVAEISSFQLEWVEMFRPKIAVLLNISEDHLDRYPDFASYRAAKERLFAAQTAVDTAVLNRDDPLVWPLREKIRSRVISFGWEPVDSGLFATPEEIVWRGAVEERFALSRVKIRGVHNVENIMAAVAAAKAVGVGAETIRRVIESFAGLEHRMEFVREKNGVAFYNDSKGTNVGATLKSLMSFSAPVILLAGGIDKKGDYGVLAEEVKRKVKKLVLFGAARGVIQNALGSLTATVVVDDLDAAVREAFGSAARGDVVLLSPACASFDMFKNYAERGRIFKDLVHAL